MYANTFVQAQEKWMKKSHGSHSHIRALQHSKKCHLAYTNEFDAAARTLQCNHKLSFKYYRMQYFAND